MWEGTVSRELLQSMVEKTAEQAKELSSDFLDEMQMIGEFHINLEDSDE